MVGDRVFFRWGPSGDRLGTVWGPSGHRCRPEFRNIYARNSPVRTKALTFTPLLTSFGCSKIPPSDHIDNLDAKHDGSHITRMTRMLKEQRHPAVSDHLDATVYRLLTHTYFANLFFRRLTEQITQVLRGWECVASMFIRNEQQTSEF